MTKRPFRQVDVFTAEAYRGNPVAVVSDADDLSTDDMQRIAHWTNLSETTFLLSPTTASADYRVRIFTPVVELPFAGHPTLGTCHAWLESGGVPAGGAVTVQECGAGLVEIRKSADGLSFAAPALIEPHPLEESVVGRIAGLLALDRSEIVDSQWLNNGLGWSAVVLDSAEDVLALSAPPSVDLDLGVVGFYPDGSPSAIEVRAFFPVDGSTREDPVTGSLNASLARWLVESGRLTAPYVATQGTLLGREGRVAVSRDDDGTIWVGGGTVTCISGQIDA